MFILSRFDPERFSAENINMLPTTCFEPFGFGKRMCPGYRLIYLKATIFLFKILPKFKFTLLDGQAIGINYGFVSKSGNEICVTVDKRL